MKILQRLSAQIFRYRLAAVCFILGQIVIYITIFGALQIYNMAMNKENDRKNAIYAQRIKIDVTTLGNKDILSKAYQEVETGNLLLSGRISVPFKESNASTRTEMLLGISEPLPYPMLSGHIPGTEDSDYGKNAVALGRDKYQYAYERDGKHYVTLCLEEYEVVGVIGSSSDYWDYKIVMNINCIGPKTLDYFTKICNYELHLDSNVSDIQTLQQGYEKVFENIKNADGSSSISAAIDKSKGESTVVNTYARENIRVNYIVYAFCLVNSMLVSYFWIIARRKEIAIRKAFGYSNIKIIRMLFGNMLEMMAAALGMFLAAYLLGYYWFHNILHIYINLRTLAGLILIMLVTSVISIVYPSFRVLRMNSAQGVVSK